MLPQPAKCRRCTVVFTRRSARPPKYCPECRPVVKRERDQARIAEMRADLRDKQSLLREIAEPMRLHLTHDMQRLMDEWIGQLDVDPDKFAPVMDDSFRGAGKNGPDEGCSTGFTDLADELERRRVAAIMHDWHAEHPGWWEEAG